MAACPTAREDDLAQAITTPVHRNDVTAFGHSAYHVIIATKTEALDRSVGWPRGHKVCLGPSSELGSYLCYKLRRRALPTELGTRVLVALGGAS
jgi:hypothetical protein